eukprot:TRINITY_DN2955_c6_g1_i1.p1 TRINITY_DN2955_c6_g1~~TRINITY_DN2955_c6_g1_i1.p1  ORF type:complete len:280 (+),score=35.65 TRINITY_DN2955_c6_g1_i1:379-1218(+)
MNCIDLHTKDKSIWREVTGSNRDEGVLLYGDLSTNRNFRYPGMIKSKEVHRRKERGKMDLFDIEILSCTFKGDYAGVKRALKNGADPDAMRLVTDKLQGYEKGALKVSHGLFLETSSLRMHRKLQLRRFVEKQCSEHLDIGAASPLHWAAAKGRSRIAKLLLRHHASPMLLAGCGASSLHIACGNYNISIVVLLLSSIVLAPCIHVKQCLQLANGNPYQVLYQGAWLDPDSMFLTLTDSSGSEGTAALEAFLRTEPFHLAAQAPIPLPPYIFRGVYSLE